MPSNDSNNKPPSVPRVPGPGAGVAAVTLTGALAGEQAAGPPALSAAPSLTALLHAFRRRWLLAVVAAILGTAVVVAVVMQVLPAKYTAEARLQVASRSAASVLLENNEPQPDHTVTKSNQEALIKSVPVLNAALNRPEVKGLPVVGKQVNPTGWLEKALKVEFKGAEILQISLSGDHPEELRLLVNAVAQAYVEYSEQREKISRLAVQEQLTNSWKEAQDSLREKRRLLQSILTSRGIDDPETAKLKYDSVVRQLEDTRKELRTLELKRIDVRSELESRKAEELGLSAKSLPDAVVDRFLQNDPTLKQLLLNLDRINDEINKTQAAANPDVSARLLSGLHAERTRAQRNLEAYHTSQTPRVAEQVRLEIQAAIAKLELDLKGVNDKQVNVEAEIKKQEADVRRQVPNTRTTPDLEALRLDISLRETGLTRLGDKIEALKLGPVLGSRVTLLQRAELPQEPDALKQLKVAGAAGVGTFCLLLFGVSFWEFRSRKISAAEEVVRDLGMNLVGTLPALPASARRPATGQATGRNLDWQNRMAESVDAIRTALLHEAKEGEVQVLMITSASGGEGKTSLASHLAASLARAWRKTLLIDGDLRKPAVHKVFDQPAEPGFSEVLRGEVGVHDVVLPTAVSRLWLMPAGHWDSHAVQALAQEGVRNLFAQMKEQYDFIVIDSCPVLPVADALLLGQHVDAVLFAVMRDVSRAPQVYAAEQRLTALGIRTLGAVVIGANATAGSVRYNYPVQSGS